MISKMARTDSDTPAALCRMIGWGAVVLTIVFLFNNYLNFWRGWPGIPALLAHLGVYGDPLAQPLSGQALTLAWTQLIFYALPAAAACIYVVRTPSQSMDLDSERISEIAAFIIRWAFWSVLIVGVVDVVIAFLRVENLLVQIAGEHIDRNFGRSAWRGANIHYPIMAACFVIAYFVRSLGFTWLALLIVIAEVQIVIARFVFSYEQPFMADLVRFWYGALFLFASPYTLIHEGHVRVDILYVGFSKVGKAWTNAMGSLLLGMPLCWVILHRGMDTKSSTINGPLLSYEITQSGFGMHVKWILAAFLGVFAVSMMIQFASYFVSYAAVLLGRSQVEHEEEEPHFA